MRFVFAIICLSIFIKNSHGTVLKRCELANKLLEKGFPSDKLEQWVCLIEAESGRMTSKKGGPNFNGSYDWGLFQINDKYWCRPGVAGGDCNTACESLLLQDISIASRCAKMVYRRHGFSAWYGWRNKCQGKLPDLAPCKLSKNTNQKSLHQKQDEHIKKIALTQLNIIV